jgi:hypothetical protein
MRQQNFSDRLFVFRLFHFTQAGWGRNKRNKNGRVAKFD